MWCYSNYYFKNGKQVHKILTIIDSIKIATQYKKDGNDLDILYSTGLSTHNIYDMSQVYKCHTYCYIHKEWLNSLKLLFVDKKRVIWNLLQYFGISQI